MALVVLLSTMAGVVAAIGPADGRSGLAADFRGRPLSLEVLSLASGWHDGPELTVSAWGQRVSACEEFVYRYVAIAPPYGANVAIDDESAVWDDAIQRDWDDVDSVGCGGDVALADADEDDAAQAVETDADYLCDDLFWCDDTVESDDLAEVRDADSAYDVMCDGGWEDEFQGHDYAKVDSPEECVTDAAFDWWVEPDVGETARFGTSIEMEGRSVEVSDDCYVDNGLEVDEEGQLPWEIDASSGGVDDSAARSPAKSLRASAKRTPESGLEVFAGSPSELLLASDNALLQQMQRLSEALSDQRCDAFRDYLESLGSEACEFVARYQTQTARDVLELTDSLPQTAALLGSYRLYEAGELEMEEAVDLLRRSLGHLTQAWVNGATNIAVNQSRNSESGPAGSDVRHAPAVANTRAPNLWGPMVDWAKGYWRKWQTVIPVTTVNAASLLDWQLKFLLGRRESGHPAAYRPESAPVAIHR